MVGGEKTLRTCASASSKFSSYKFVAALSPRFCTPKGNQIKNPILRFPRGSSQAKTLEHASSLAHMAIFRLDLGLANLNLAP